ncbi:MAG: glutamine--fructose-6-phosphate transaminase (isomerizing) [Clostridiales bacterium]|nr:glutamine--fructose-6-phosphate transaminase (isomerizing) [Clostridiales bacterium]
MCGIVGYLGENAVRISAKKLELLQYRGYDSAGVGFIQNGKIHLSKTVGSVKNLRADYDSFSAIAHTRWATHGNVCTRNAHPHTSGENWAIVHNGIIENYTKLREGEFVSDTDSEVISFLLEKHGKGLNSVIETAKNLEGSFAILALEKGSELYAIKNKSPLFASANKSGIMFASDPICFCGFSDTYYTFCDKEVAKASGKTLKFYDFDGNEIAKECVGLDIDQTQSDKGDFDTFMRKEIYDIPFCQKRIYETYTNSYLLPIIKLFQSADEVWFIGCGTAYHACAYGEDVFAKAGKKTRAFIASEFRYSHIFPSKNTLCVFISQSGETADTLGALEKVDKICKTVALTNVGYSALAKSCQMVLPVLAGEERAVASTKAYVCQLTVLSLIARAISDRVVAIEIVDKQTIDELSGVAKRLVIGFDSKELFVLGRNADYVTAMECALKVKEVSYINANAYPTGELKHGFIALLSNDAQVLVFATSDDLMKKNCSGAQECKSRGANVTVITTSEHEFAGVDEIIKVGSYIQSVVFAQVFALECAIKRDTNPDMPKNLAKSVTVE